MLLLAFARVLVPDSVWLALHRHEHTRREAAHEGHGYKAVVDQQHTHCDTDHLFNAPALPAPGFEFGVVVPVRFGPPTAQALTSVWARRLVQTRCLRGPPGGRAAHRRAA